MKVNEVMKKDVATCSPQEDCAAAVRAMREHACGFLPVVDTHGSVVGVLTDRDVCLFASERGRSMTHMAIADAMSRPVFTCMADEHVKTALAAMAKHQVRRLPVIDTQGHLQGVLSIDDLVAAPHRRGGVSAEEIVDALKQISARKRLEAVPA